METLKLQELNQDIILLIMLSVEPEPPNSNAVVENEEVGHAKRRSSSKRELDNVDNFTLVCATSRNGEDVIALCLHEGVQPNHCTIRIAMNTKLSRELLENIRSVARVLGKLEKATSQSIQKWY